MNMLDTAYLYVMDKHNVQKEDLSFIGISDNSKLKLGDLYHFNIMNPSHKSYQSTVTYMVGIEKEKEKK